MPIQVTCPGCLTRFQVNDKFAGKKGPCPKCKAQITIPDVGDAVVVHAPEEFGPKDAKGRAVLKPISREEIEGQSHRRGLIAVAAVVVIAVIVAVVLRVTAEPTGDVSLPVRLLGIVLLAPPLAWAGYFMARDPELAPYTGRELMVRLAIAGAALALCWLIYAFVPAYLFRLDRPSEAEYWLAGVALAVMIAVGAVVAMATFELEFGGGLAVSAAYFIVTLGLALIAGIPLAGQAA